MVPCTGLCLAADQPDAIEPGPLALLGQEAHPIGSGKPSVRTWIMTELAQEDPSGGANCPLGFGKIGHALELTGGRETALGWREGRWAVCPNIRLDYWC